MAQGLDPPGSEMSTLDVSTHITTLNNGISVNFNQGFINVVLAIVPYYYIYSCMYM